MNRKNIIIFSLSIILCNYNIHGKTFWRYYKVKQGDTLTQIAKRTGVALAWLTTVNRLNSANHIYHGQKLKIKLIKTRTKKRCPTCRPKKNPLFFPPIGKKKTILSFKNWGDFHNYGIIWRVKSQSTIYASSAGRVIRVNRLEAYGRYIILDHGKGWLSMYSHLGQLDIHQGDYLNTGDIIGKARGDKLFFSISYKGKPLDPRTVLQSKHAYYKAG